MYHYQNVEIRGITASVPKETRETEDCHLLSENEKKTILKHYGIEKVHKSVRLTTLDHCSYAAKKLIKGLQWQSDEIDLLISVTQTPDYLMPSNATYYHKKLGLKDNCIVFEINMGCSGYIQGLMVAIGLLQTYCFNKALVLTGETTYNVSQEDKATLPFMGDAGTATALISTSSEKKILFNALTNGDLANSIQIPIGGSFSYKDKTYKDITNENLKVVMKGENVKDFIFHQTIPNIQHFMQENNLSTERIDYFVFHQVNHLITNGMARKLDIPKKKMLTCYEEYGNTSSASIPLCLCHHSEQLLQKENQLLLSGFGVGMSNLNMLVPNFNPNVLNIHHI